MKIHYVAVKLNLFERRLNKLNNLVVDANSLWLTKLYQSYTTRQYLQVGDMFINEVSLSVCHFSFSVLHNT